jgi:hypothetical protein
MLGYQMLMDGEAAKARRALTPVAFHPHGGGVAEFAARVIAAIDAGGAEAGLKAWRDGGDKKTETAAK